MKCRHQPGSANENIPESYIEALQIIFEKHFLVPLKHADRGLNVNIGSILFWTRENDVFALLALTNRVMNYTNR